MGGRLFPISFEKTHSKKRYKKIPSGGFRIGAVHISHCRLRHPQGSLAFKFKEKNRSVVLATDTEHPMEGVDEKLAAFALKADCLIYDAMYTPQEYRAGRKGWGHSTWKAGVKLAREAKVRTLFLSHYNPLHTDTKIDRLLQMARKEFPRTLSAREGKKI